MRRFQTATKLLSLKQCGFFPVLVQGGGGQVAYFSALLLQRVRNGAPRPVVVDPSDPEDSTWLERVSDHYDTLGFTLEMPDSDGHVEVRFYTNPVSEAVAA